MIARPNQMQRSFCARFGTAVFLTSALLLGCSEQSTAPDLPLQLVGSTTGTYTIRFVDGRRLPVLVCAGEVKVTAGSLRLRADHTFLASVRFSSPPTAARETYQETGTYSRQAGTNRIIFASSSRPGTTWNGTLLADGSIRIRYWVCGEGHAVKLVRSL
jgi:hypothetical protein